MSKATAEEIKEAFLAGSGLEPILITALLVAIGVGIAVMIGMHVIFGTVKTEESNFEKIKTMLTVFAVILAVLIIGSMISRY